MINRLKKHSFFSLLLVVGIIYAASAQDNESSGDGQSSSSSSSDNSSSSGTTDFNPNSPEWAGKMTKPVIDRGACHRSSTCTDGMGVRGYDNKSTQEKATTGYLPGTPSNYNQEPALQKVNKDLDEQFAPKQTVSKNEVNADGTKEYSEDNQSYKDEWKETSPSCKSDDIILNNNSTSYPRSRAVALGDRGYTSEFAVIAPDGFQYKASSVCFYDINIDHKGIKTEPGTVEAIQIVRKISSIIGIQDIPLVMSAKIDNAVSCVLNGKRALLYNPEFLSKMQISQGDKWVIYSIFAHELGHHFNGHTTSNDPNLWLQELQADYYAGFVLAKLGASLAEAQEALKRCEYMHPQIAQTGTNTHPPYEDRLKESEKGWNEGNSSQTIEQQKVEKQNVSSTNNRKNASQSEFDNSFDELHKKVESSK